MIELIDFIFGAACGGLLYFMINTPIQNKKLKVIREDLTSAASASISIATMQYGVTQIVQQEDDDGNMVDVEIKVLEEPFNSAIKTLSTKIYQL